jgi:K+-sensing histidine kinase KdpD
LSVSRRIVEEHGGWIEAANCEEGGATFTIWLPKAGATTPSLELGAEPLMLEPNGEKGEIR